MKNDKPFPFTVAGRVRSLGYALTGIRRFFRREHNAWLHLAATGLVIILLLIVPVSAAEAAILLLATGMVWAAELFNTVIEQIMDFISEKQQPQIGYIKDLAAAAVLVTALAAVAAGGIIFIPKFLSW